MILQGMPPAPGAGGVDAAPACAVALCAGAAVLLMAGHRDGARRARLLLAGGGHADRPGLSPPPWGRRTARVVAGLRDRLNGPSARAWWCLPVAVLLGLLGKSWLPLAGGAVAAALSGRWLRRRERRRVAERRERAVVEMCAAVASELRAGRQPDGALLSAGVPTAEALGSEGTALLAAARFGGDVPRALREAAGLPGAEGLRGAAACWQVSVEGGAGLADGLDRVASALRLERDQRADLHAQLAGPRSTALVLALLPAFGLLLGTAMGADPLRVLLHSPAGLACLAVGGVLEWAGLAWVARLVRAAETPTLPARPSGKGGTP